MTQLDKAATALATTNEEQQEEGREASGLEDIRVVAAAIQESQEIRLPPEDEDEDAAIGGGFGSMAAASLVEAVESKPLPLTQGQGAEGGKSPAMTVMIGAIAALALAGVGLATLAGSGDEPPGAEPTVASRNAAVPAAAPAEEREEKPEPEPEPEAEPAEGTEEPAGEDSKPAEEPEATSTQRKPAARGSKKADKPDDAGEPAVAEDDAPEEDDSLSKPPAEAPAPAPSDSIDADCVLNPNLPQCKTAKKADKPAEEVEDTSGLPEKLSKVDVRDGFRAVKAKAKACGPEHGVEKGTKVRVKVSISGKTGQVTSAKAMGEHSTSPVGKCVAAALEEATFGKFRKSVMGVTYPVTL